jgi:hypothetical protein
MRDNSAYKTAVLPRTNIVKSDLAGQFPKPNHATAAESVTAKSLGNHTVLSGSQSALHLCKERRVRLA